MSHTVVWLSAAEQELAELWLNASNRSAVTEALRRIERSLKNDPENEGESRPDQRRILFSAPIGVMYRVLAADRVVVVSRVWKFAMPQE